MSVFFCLPPLYIILSYITLAEIQHISLHLPYLYHTSLTSLVFKHHFGDQETLAARISSSFGLLGATWDFDGHDGISYCGTYFEGGTKATNPSGVYATLLGDRRTFQWMNLFGKLLVHVFI